MSEPRHILFVDDDALILTIAERALSCGRYCVSCAASAAEAFRMLDTMSFDLVIVDIMMPEMDGFTFLVNMHANRKLAVTPSIAISVRCDSETKARALACGADMFLPKPLNWLALPELIQDFLHAPIATEDLRIGVLNHRKDPSDTVPAQ